MPKQLTSLAHEIVAAKLEAGDLVIDATVGNGHDTLFLAEQVVQTGQARTGDRPTFRDVAAPKAGEAQLACVGGIMRLENLS